MIGKFLAVVIWLMSIWLAAFVGWAVFTHPIKDLGGLFMAVFAIMAALAIIAVASDICRDLFSRRTL